MGANPEHPPIPTRVYHITHLDNLLSMTVDERGIMSVTYLRSFKIGNQDISNRGIQARRVGRPVPGSAQGTLPDYVPFSFAPRSAMLYAAHMGNGMAYRGGQRPIVHLVTTVQHVNKVGFLKFALTNRHAISSHFWDEIEHLSEVDWGVMAPPLWALTAEQKERRLAEFLVHDLLPWRLIEEVGVIDEQTRSRVEKLLANARYQPPVRVHRDWYF